MDPQPPQENGKPPFRSPQWSVPEKTNGTSKHPHATTENFNLFDRSNLQESTPLTPADAQVGSIAERLMPPSMLSSSLPAPSGSMLSFATNSSLNAAAPAFEPHSLLPLPTPVGQHCQSQEHRSQQPQGQQYQSQPYQSQPHQSDQHSLKTLRLTSADQAAPSVYIRLLYIFPFPDALERPTTEKYLHSRLQAVVNRWPFLAGRVRSSERPGDLLELQYQDPAATVLLPYERTDIGFTTFRMFQVRILGPQDNWHLDYDQCAAQRFKPEILTTQTFSSLPRHPAPGLASPAFGMQVNWLVGGLVLCFAFNHAVVDGHGIQKVLEHFAGKAQGFVDPRCPVADSGMKEDREDWMMVFRPPRWVLEGEIPPPEEYNFNAESVSIPLPYQSKQKVVARILRFNDDMLRELKKKAEVRVRVDEKKRTGAYTLGPWLSTTDVLCAIIWISVMRERYLRGRGYTHFGYEQAGKLNIGEVAKFNIAVNARTKMDPPIPDEYIGNTFVTATVEIKMDEILGFTNAFLENAVRARMLLQMPTPATKTLLEKPITEGLWFSGVNPASGSVPAVGVTPPATAGPSSDASAKNYSYPMKPYQEPFPRENPSSETTKDTRKDSKTTPPPSPGPLPDLNADTIAYVAKRIRDAIDAVDDTYARRRFNYAAYLCRRPDDEDEGNDASTAANGSEFPATTEQSTAPSPAACTDALHRALDRNRTGLDFSSWVGFPADIDFGIPGVSSEGGRPEFVRKTWSANPGTMNILPRRSNESMESGADWEVLLALAECEMNGVLSQIATARGLNLWGAST